MKWNYVKDGVLPKDCELVVGIICWRDEEYVYSLEYRSPTRMFIVKSAERGYDEYLREDQVKAWVSFSEIHADFKDKDKLRNLLSSFQEDKSTVLNVTTRIEQSSYSKQYYIIQAFKDCHRKDVLFSRGDLSTAEKKARHYRNKNNCETRIIAVKENVSYSYEYEVVKETENDNKV